MNWLWSVGISLGLCVSGQALEVQGHRGARAEYPENSLPAFAAAINAGIDVLELDVQMTKEGVVVVHHDYFLNTQLCAYADGRALPSDQLIFSLNLSQIKEVDCGCRANSAFPEQKRVIGTQIPTLEEVFQLVQHNLSAYADSVRFNVELKRDPRHPEWSAPPEQLAQAVVKLVRAYGMESRVYYSSFDPASLAAIRKEAPQASLGLIFNEESLCEAAKVDHAGGKILLMQIAGSLQVDVLSPEHVLLQNKEDVQRYQEAGFKVVTWTVNEPHRWAELQEMGVDGLITDRPVELKEYLKMGT